MKRILNILIIIFGILFVYAAIHGLLGECLLKRYFSIRCPGCGLTRSFIALLNLEFIKSFHYNILGIPLFICSILVLVSLFIDVILNKMNTINVLNKIFSKCYVLIILALVISMVVNNIRGI